MRLKVLALLACLGPLTSCIGYSGAQTDGASAGDDLDAQSARASAGNLSGLCPVGKPVYVYTSVAPVPLGQWLPTLYETYCKHTLACVDPTTADGGYGTLEGCKALTSLTFTDPRVSLAQAGKVLYDPAEAAKCLQAHGAFCGDFLQCPMHACENVFTGTVAQGGACEADAVCKSDHCKKSDPKCPGTCVARRGTLGEACENSNDCQYSLVCEVGHCAPWVPKSVGEGQPCSGEQCAPGLACAFKPPGKYICAAVKRGDDCSDFRGCPKGLYCEMDTVSGPGVCALRGQVGAPCTTILGDLTVSRPCQPPLVCVPTEAHKATCQPRVKLGGACVSDIQCAGQDLACMQGACRVLPKKGETCVPESPWWDSSGPQCMPPYVCMGGKCSDLPVAGKPCAGDKCAKGHYCTTTDCFGHPDCGKVLKGEPCKVCEKLPGKGETCRDKCQEGLACDFHNDCEGTCKLAVAPVCAP